MKNILSIRNMIKASIVLALILSTIGTKKHSKMTLAFFSAYTLRDGTRIYVIREADRSATAILLSEEY
jgi:hypothetical protein